MAEILKNWKFVMLVGFGGIAYALWIRSEKAR